MVDVVSFLGRRLLPANTLLSTEADIDTEEEEKEKTANRRNKGRGKEKKDLAAKMVNFSQKLLRSSAKTRKVSLLPWWTQQEGLRC